jgi:hypothetical protein
MWAERAQIETSYQMRPAQYPSAVLKLPTLAWCKTYQCTPIHNQCSLGSKSSYLWQICSNSLHELLVWGTAVELAPRGTGHWNLQPKSHAGNQLMMT